MRPLISFFGDIGPRLILAGVEVELVL